MTCKCHQLWGRKGRKERRWFILTTIFVVLIGTIGVIVITEAELRPERIEELKMRYSKVLYPDQSEDRIPGDNRFMGLPFAPHCGHLYGHPGKHKLWAECMGVGYDDTKIDRLLYDDREGLAPDCSIFPRLAPYHEWMAHCVPAGGDKKGKAYQSTPPY